MITVASYPAMLGSSRSWHSAGHESLRARRASTRAEPANSAAVSAGQRSKKTSFDVPAASSKTSGSSPRTSGNQTSSASPEQQRRDPHVVERGDWQTAAPGRRGAARQPVKQRVDGQQHGVVDDHGVAEPDHEVRGAADRVEGLREPNARPGRARDRRERPCAGGAATRAARRYAPEPPRSHPRGARRASAIIGAAAARSHRGPRRRRVAAGAGQLRDGRLAVAVRARNPAGSLRR